MSKLGLIAGGGALPVSVAARCEAEGRPVFVVRLAGFADVHLARYPGIEAGMAEFGKILSALKKAGCTGVCFAGTVSRPDFKTLKPDLKGAALLPGIIAAATKGDDALLRKILSVFEGEGYVIEGADDILGGETLPVGALGSVQPSEAQLSDLRKALYVAEKAGELDIGQGAVVCDGLVLAVEAQEGTDAMLARVASLPADLRGSAADRKGVLGKAPKPIQDLRVDMPVIGARTIELAAAAGLAGVGGLAGKLILIDQAGLIEAADRLGLFVWGEGAGERAMSRPLKIMLVAAEASGDALGAGLAGALKVRLGAEVAFVGVGGPRMAEQGVRSPFDIAELSIHGWLEGLKAYGIVKRRVADTVALGMAERPDAVVLIDSWGFTIRVAKALRAALPGVPLIKYVGPQVWASRPGRAKTLAAAVDHLLALYAFDARWFEREGLATTVVGSQALHVDMSSADPAAFRAERGIAPGAPLLVVLPGSRPSEIRLMTPVYEAAIARLKAADPTLEIAVVAAGTVAADVTARIATWPFRAHVVGEDQKYAAMRAATVALATSGTVSTELALAGAPTVIAYRFQPLSYAIMKPFFTGKYATLFNHAADEEIARELIQNDATPEKVAAEVGRLLGDPEARRTQAKRQTAALDLMGREGRDPSEIAADAVLRVIAGKAGV